MKVAIPVSEMDFDPKSPLIKGFHETNFIGVFDADNRQMQVLPVFSGQNQDFAIFNLFKVNGISAVISPKMSLMALKVFSDYRIDVYRAHHDLSLDENIEKYLNQDLSRFTFVETFRNMQCSSSGCSSCDQTCKN